MRQALYTISAAGIAALAIAGCSAGEPEPNPTYTADATVVQPGMPGEPASTVAPGETATRPPAATFNDADVAYVQDMLVHHGQAITMTALAPERATHPQVKAIASRISDSQRPELRMFTDWLKARSQLRTDPEGHGHAAMPGMATPQQLEQLETARGTAFDRLFLQLMSAHHGGAVQMSQDVMTKGSDPQVQEIAAEIGAGQAAEIGRMQDVSRQLS